MAYYYKKRYSYEDAAPVVAKLRKLLEEHCKRLVNEERMVDGKLALEWYFMPNNLPKEVSHDIMRCTLYLEAGGFLSQVPTEGGSFITVNDSADGRRPTVTPTHVRLPKLSHLITLTPEDFFTLLHLIAKAKNPGATQALILNFGDAGIDDFPNHVLNRFFTLLRTNYILNPETSDRKWTPREEIKKLCDLPPSRENHLLAMQYLTVIQNKDLMLFPVEAMLDLDLEWKQIDNNYAKPPYRRALI